MKKILGIISVLFFAGNLYAGQVIERHNFYNRYDPASGSFVYDNTGATATGDQVAVNTYSRKSIQISGITVGEDIQIRIEGRSKDQVNTPNWAILDVVNFGSASADTSKNIVVDVTEYVDFLRVGIKTNGASGASNIDVEGLFTNLER